MTAVHSCERSLVADSSLIRGHLAQERALRQHIYKLLGKPRMASRQFLAPDKDWIYSRARTISASQFYAHLRGQSTLTLSPLSKINGQTCVLFICFDIDEMFMQRLGIVREVLDELGTLPAAWAATGSDDGRGKVILSLASPMPQKDAVILASCILDKARRRLLWGTETKKVDVFPKRGQGGVVRILGRNQVRAREGHVDVPLDMYGESSDLRTVSPYVHGITLEDRPCPTSGSLPLSKRIDSGKEKSPTNDLDSGKLALPVFAERARTTPYTGDGTSIYKDMRRLACAAIRRSGNETEGRSVFESWCDELRAQIPSDKSQTLRQVDDTSGRARAWRSASSFMKTGIGIGDELNYNLGNWHLLTPRDYVRLENFEEPTRGAWRAYNAAAERIIAVARNPHCFRLAYSEWQRLGDYDDKSNCRKDSDAAERAGLLFRLDRGEARVNGLVTLLTLVGRGQTLQQAYDLGIQSAEFQQRRRVREERRLPPFLGCVKDNRLFFPSEAAPGAFQQGESSHAKH